MEKHKGGYNQQGNPNLKNRGQQRSNKKATTCFLLTVFYWPTGVISE